MSVDKASLPPPPRLIGSLLAGFEAVANNITVIILPVLLDLFLWMGPHLRLKSFFQPLIAELPSMQLPVLPGTPGNAAIAEQWAAFTEGFNLFVLLRTFPVGTPSLLASLANLQAGGLPVGSPLGGGLDLDAGMIIDLAAWGLLLLLAGWLVGGLYYYWVSGVSLKPEPRRFGRLVGQSVLLSAFWIAVLAAVGLPALLLFTVVMLVSPLLGELMLFILAMFALWLILPVFFSPHGIFTYQHNAMQALRNSLRLVRFTLPNSGMFLLAIFVIGQGLNMLWHTPPETSWWLLIGIAGHAFISTALLAASFIFYRDQDAWLRTVLEQLKSRTTPAQA